MSRPWLSGPSFPVSVISLASCRDPASGCLPAIVISVGSRSYPPGHSASGQSCPGPDFGTVQRVRSVDDVLRNLDEATAGLVRNISKLTDADARGASLLAEPDHLDDRRAKPM